VTVLGSPVLVSTVTLDGRAYLPLSGLARLPGVTVKTDPAAGTVNVTRLARTRSFPVNFGKAVSLEVVRTTY
jgi:hypothetical protein